jgi:hypothetical protein
LAAKQPVENHSIDSFAAHSLVGLDITMLGSKEALILFAMDIPVLIIENGNLLQQLALANHGSQGLFLGMHLEEYQLGTLPRQRRCLLCAGRRARHHSACAKGGARALCH